ncbi:MAG: O-antigen ligase family protein, partial [Bacteroidota bacterium]
WAASGLAAVTLALSIVPAFSARFSSSFRLAENLNRLYIWRSTLNMIKDHPWFGVGAGVFMHVYPKYVLPGAPEPVVAYAHNLFLQVLAEFGLVGFLVFVAILGRVMWMSWQLARTGDVLYQGIFAALIGVLIHQQVDIPIWGLEVGGAFWVVVGLVVTLYRNELGAAGRTPSETMLGG